MASAAAVDRCPFHRHSQLCSIEIHRFAAGINLDSIINTPYSLSNGIATAAAWWNTVMRQPFCERMEFAMADKSHHSGKMMFLGAVLAVLLLGMGSFAATKFFGVIIIIKSNQPETEVANSSSEADAGSYNKSAPTDEKPQEIVPTLKKSEQVRRAIEQRDFSTANKIANEVLGNSKLTFGQFTQFAYFLKYAIHDDNQEFLESLNAWVESDPKLALPHLFRARYYFTLFWKVRGPNFISETNPDHLALASRYSALAGADAGQALLIDGERNPYAYSLAVEIAGTNGSARDVDRYFAMGIKAHKEYYDLYRLRLRYLTPKWGGSIDKMKSFTEFYADNSDKNSPVRLLYIHYYASLLNAVYVACLRAEEKDRPACISKAMAYFSSNLIEIKVREALDIFKMVDSYRYGALIEDILFDMVSMPGAESYANQFLLWAAERMHTDNQLMETTPGKNNYVLDKITGYIWYRNRNYQNSINKYEEALRDINNITFPGEEEKNIARAKIYNRMVKSYLSMSQYERAISYHDKAVSLIGESDEDYRYTKCYAYNGMTKYKLAVKECTAQVENYSDSLSRYWRGDSYASLGENERALSDLKVIADSEDHAFRSNAAILMSVLYAKLNNFQAELDVLNNHPYLFDEKVRSKHDLSISYNNRCHAYMKLGELKKALADCNASIAFDNIPDAYQKKQQLEQMLKSPP